MGWLDGNLYYNPEKFGLETFGSVDNGGSYEFDMFAVWRSAENPAQFYWAQDEGCSCPSPFENFNSLDSAASGTNLEAAEALKSWSGKSLTAQESNLLERLYTA